MSVETYRTRTTSLWVSQPNLAMLLHTDSMQETLLTAVSTRSNLSSCSYASKSDIQTELHSSEATMSLARSRLYTDFTMSAYGNTAAQTSGGSSESHGLDIESMLTLAGIAAKSLIT